MKKLFMFMALAAIMLYGATQTATAAPKKEKDKNKEVQNDTIKAQVDPLIIDITDFEGRQLSGERAHVTLVNGEFSARIPTVAGMIAIGTVTSTNGLVFDKVKVTPSQVHYGKKGKSYNFSFTAREATFLNRWTNASWRISITVQKDGYANVSIESDEISRVARSRIWHFGGQVNQGRTEAATLILESARQKAAAAAPTDTTAAAQ